METYTSKTRVLLSGAGGPAALGVMKAIDGPDVEFHCGDMDANAAGLYLVPQDRRTIFLPAGHPGFVDGVLSYCRRHAIDVFWPTVDDELSVVAARRHEFEQAGVKIVLPTNVGLHACLDKWKLAQVCDGWVPLPKTAVFDETFRPESMVGPVIVKPRRGSGGRGVRLVRKVSELAHIPRHGDLIVQEELPGDEYSVDVFVSKDRLSRAAVPRVRAKVDSGIAVTSETIRDSGLQRMALEVMDAIQLTGAANIQFKRDRTGAPRLLEVNPRVAGTMILSVRAGVNLPKLALDDCLGRPVPRQFDFEEIAVVRTHQEHFISPLELRQMHHRMAQSLAGSWRAPAA